MIGTGVFTSLGYQLVDISSPFFILLLWLVGGVIALCGALSYAELSTRFPRSGGEYNFISEIFHPALGFVSGWVSAVVGFAAPTALAAMTFAAYLAAAVEATVVINQTAAALFVVVLLAGFHVRSRAASSGVQDVFTLMKVLLIVLFCVVVAYATSENAATGWLPALSDIASVPPTAFAIALIFVNYAYTGWNAATYITGELESPQQNLPRVLIVGTASVIVLYLCLNMVFLYSTPASLMSGQIEVGVIVARYTYGETGALIMGLVLSLMLVSTVSAMMMAGPRVLQVMGEDFSLFAWLGERDRNGVPVRAIWGQCALTILFILSASFEAVLLFSGFMLGMNSLFVVSGLLVVRWRDSNTTPAFLTPWFPLVPLVFIAITTATLGYIAASRPVEVLAGVCVLVVGFLAYAITVKFDSAKT